MQNDRIRMKEHVARCLAAADSDCGLSIAEIAARLPGHQPKTAPRAIATDVAIACDLLVLQNLARSPDRGIYRATPQLLALLPKTAAARRSADRSPRRPAVAQTRAVAWPIAGLSVAAIGIAGCSAFVLQGEGDRSQLNGRAQPRLEQVIVAGTPVFRYCTDDCPRPTPKIAARPVRSVTAAQEAPNQDAPAEQQPATPVAVVASQAIGPGAGAPAADTAPQAPATATGAQDHSKVDAAIAAQLMAQMRSMRRPAGPAPAVAPPVAKGVEPAQPIAEPKALQVTPHEPAQATSTSSPARDKAVPLPPEPHARVNSPAAPGAGVQLASAAQPGGPVLRVDDKFASFQGLVGFADGRSVLGPQGRAAIESVLAPARQAERVQLKGHVGEKVLTEQGRKLAIGRAVAVKLALAANGVEREKITILSPADNDLLESDRRSARNRSVEVRLKMRTPVAESPRAPSVQS
jgi:outer membrane protein OmpA-like peptidoglycan-associated protein